MEENRTREILFDTNLVIIKRLTPSSPLQLSPTLVHGGLNACVPPLNFSVPLRAFARCSSYFAAPTGAAALVRLKVRTNSGVKVPVGQSTGCP